MARGILVSYSGYPYTPSSLMPDNGLANLAGSLKRDGHDALILDYGTTDTIARLYPRDIFEKIRPIYNKIAEGIRPGFSDKASIFYLNQKLEKHQRREVNKIAKEVLDIANDWKADFVGFKLWNGDGFTGSIRIAEYLKRNNPDMKIFAGGPHADLFKELILKRTDAFDVMAYSEGEEIINLLAEYATGDRANLSKISNIIYRNNSGEIVTNRRKLISDLDSLAEPLYDEEIYPSMKGNKKIKIITLDESRGCPFGCYFCAQPVKSGSYTRVKTPERVHNEIKRLKELYGISVFRYAGSSTPGKLMFRVAKKLRESNINVEYSSFAEANLLNDRETMAVLRNSGLQSLFFGIESGSQKMLNSIHKSLNVDVLKKALIASKETGIFTVGSVIYPLPGETSESKEETLRFLEETRPDSIPIQFAGLYPGTPWFSNPTKYGFQVDINRYPRRVMDYKIKLLFPPDMWKDPGYKIDGKSFKKFVRETMGFIKDVERMGIMTGVSDDQFLMARAIEMTPKEFRDKNRRYFFTGDVEKISKMIESINNYILRI